jgi:hypothetical protein
MAAIIEPRRVPVVPERPVLRLVPADGRRPIDLPVDAPLSLGLGPGHVIAAVVALVVVMMGALAIGNGALASLAPAPPAPASATASDADTTTVTVAPGDTLWSIARQMQPTGEVRPLVDQLVALNGSTPLQPGDEVIVPA